LVHNIGNDSLVKNWQVRKPKRGTFMGTIKSVIVAMALIMSASYAFAGTKEAFCPPGSVPAPSAPGSLRCVQAGAKIEKYKLPRKGSKCGPLGHAKIRELKKSHGVFKRGFDYCGLRNNYSGVQVAALPKLCKPIYKHLPLVKRDVRSGKRDYCVYGTPRIKKVSVKTRNW
jgi:hypothetical protein